MTQLKHLSRVLLLVLGPAALVLPASATASSSQITFFEAPRDLTAIGGVAPSSDASRAAAFADFKALGVSALRVNLPWYDVAPNASDAAKPAFDATDPAAYNWGTYGTTIDTAKAQGMKVLISLSSPVPRWATAAKADTVTRPDPAEYKLFATAAAKRFGSANVMWSIWNEPNLPRFLKPQVANGKTVAGRLYRDLFVAGRAGIRAAGQTTPVLFGETAPVGGAVDDRTYPLTFLRDALCLSSKYKYDKSCGAALTLDGVSHHPYQFSGGKLKKDDVTYRSLSRLTTALDKAAKAKAINKKVPVYLTEFGIQSCPDTTLGVTPQAQLEERARVERTAYANSRVKGFSQYLLTDDVDTGGFQTGLRYSANGKAKTGYDAFHLVLDAEPYGKKSGVSLWGLVRGATSGTVAIERRNATKGSFKRLKTAKIKSNGAFTLKDASGTKKSQYRFRWTSPTGKVTSPYVRTFSDWVPPTYRCSKADVKVATK